MIYSQLPCDNCVLERLSHMNTEVQTYGAVFPECGLVGERLCRLCCMSFIQFHFIVIFYNWSANVNINIWVCKFIFIRSGKDMHFRDMKTLTLYFTVQMCLPG